MQGIKVGAIVLSKMAPWRVEVSSVPWCCFADAGAILQNAVCGSGICPCHPLTNWMCFAIVAQGSEESLPPATAKPYGFLTKTSLISMFITLATCGEGSGLTLS